MGLRRQLNYITGNAVTHYHFLHVSLFTSHVPSMYHSCSIDAIIFSPITRIFTVSVFKQDLHFAFGF